MKLDDFIKELKQRDDYLILTHLRPDGDTLGSAAGLCRALRLAGKRAFLYRNPQVTETYRDIVAPFFAPEGFAPGCVLAVDTASTGLFPRGWDGDVDLAIDHHPSNEGFAALTLCDAEKASCAEVVMGVVKGLCGGIDRETADMLYVGVSTDTGCFVYGNTTADTHRAAAELMDSGCAAQRLNKRFFRTFSRSRLMLEGMIFSTLRSYRDGKINIAVVTLDMMARAGATENDCDDLASLAGRVEGNVVSATIRELQDGSSKISVRTTPEVNASAVCARFGGGGHAMASGCTVDAPPERAVELILASIDEVWR